MVQSFVSKILGGREHIFNWKKIELYLISDVHAHSDPLEFCVAMLVYFYHWPFLQMPVELI